MNSNNISEGSLELLNLLVLSFGKNPIEIYDKLKNTNFSDKFCFDKKIKEELLNKISNNLSFKIIQPCNKCFLAFETESDYENWKSLLFKIF